MCNAAAEGRHYTFVGRQLSFGGRRIYCRGRHIPFGIGGRQKTFGRHYAAFCGPYDDGSKRFANAFGACKSFITPVQGASAPGRPFRAAGASAAAASP